VWLFSKIILGAPYLMQQIARCEVSMSGSINRTKESEMNLQSEGDIGNETNMPACVIRQELTTEYSTEQQPSLSLDERGVITDCNKSFEMLFGVEWHELVLHHVTRVFTQLSAEDISQAGEVYPLLDYLTRCSQRYQAKNRHGETFYSNLIFVRDEREGKVLLRLMVFPSDDGE
jgi:hypothetical protein